MKKAIIVVLALMLILSFAGCASGSDQITVVVTKNAPEAIGPYSQAQIVNGFVYTSGQIGIDPASGALADGLEAQCEQVFKNLAAILEAAGSDIGKCVKTTLYITDMDDFSVVNGIYAEYFTEPFPARSCVEVSALPKGALIECEVVAVK